MDLTKAVSVMAIHEGLVEAYHGTRKPFLNAIPKVLIPSTSGTGSEVTPGAVLVNTKTKFKRGIGSRWISADYAVLNGRLTLSMPAHVTAATGMDALAHAIESYTARNANPISRMYSKEAFSLVFKNLDRIFDHPNDLSIRNNILLGSCLAGFAIYNSNTGACHALAYPLGIYHQIPHGVAVGQLITKVVEINIAKGCLDYADLFDLIEAPYKSELVGKVERDKKARSFGAVLKTYKPLQYLKRFEEYGLRHQDIPFLAERGLDLAPALSNNPVDFVIEDARIALTKALS
jgi:alcohol dehydrogenase